MGVNGRIIGFMLHSDTLQITPEILGLIARIDEFKGAWRALGTLAPERLSALRQVATIESIGSSTRIEGSKLSDRDVERLLANLQIKSFATRDEQEVAGYAEVMELVFRSWEDIATTAISSPTARRTHGIAVPTKRPRTALPHSTKTANRSASYSRPRHPSIRRAS